MIMKYWIDNKNEMKETYFEYSSLDSIRGEGGKEGTGGLSPLPKNGGKPGSPKGGAGMGSLSEVNWYLC